MAERETPGQRIRNLREAAFITQKDFAERIGVAPSQLSRIESGETKTISSDILIAIATEFDVSTDYLLGLSTFQKPRNVDVTMTELSEVAFNRMVNGEMDMDVLNRLIEHKHFPHLIKIIRIYFADELEYGIQSRNMMLDVLSDTIMEFPTTSEEAEKAKREDVMLFRAQKFAPHEADFERIKNVFLSILKDIKKDMDEKEPTSPPVQMEFLKKLMGAIRELSLPKNPPSPEKAVDWTISQLAKQITITENARRYPSFLNLLQYLANVVIDYNRAIRNFFRGECLSLIDAGVGCVGVLGCHLPERIFDDDRRVVAHAQLQKEDFLPFAGAQEIRISFGCSVPALVLYKFIIAAEVHGHGFAAMRADGEKFRRYFHIFLPLHHLPNDGFVIESFLTARLAALEQTIIALRIEQPLFVKSGFLKTVIHIRRDNEIVLVSHQLQKVIVDWLGRILIAVDVDISAPICPMLLKCCIRIEPTGIHIPKAVLLCEIGEVFFKPFAGVDESGRSGKPCARADNHGVAIPQSGSEPLNLLGAVFRRCVCPNP